MSKMDDAKLRAQLAELRVALAAIEGPTVDEASLRARLRAARRSPQPVATAPRVARGAAPRYFAAAGVALACVMGLILALTRGGEPAPSAAAATAPPRSSVDAPAFQSLPSSPGFSSTASYSVVRVRIPLSLLAVVPGSEQGGTIDADLLVGEDGLAHGIRFAGGGAAVGAAAVQ